MKIKRQLVAVGLASVAIACGKDLYRPQGGCATCPSPGHTLSGLVTAMTTAGPVPVAGAQVRESQTGHSATTSTLGFYSITLIEVRSSVTVSASKAGYTTGTTTVATSGDTRVDLQFDPRSTYTVSGVISAITPTGLTPIEGVWVDVVSWDNVTNQYTEGITTTDQHGFYSIAELWGGPGVENAVWISKAGYRIEPQTNPPCDGCFRTFTVTANTTLDIQLEPR
jgi:hypothetical protein